MLIMLLVIALGLVIGALGGLFDEPRLHARRRAKTAKFVRHTGLPRLARGK